jgi:hypothetical protein
VTGAYGELLRALRRGTSATVIQRAAGLHPTQLKRTEQGSRSPEGPDEVLAVARAIGASPEERDRMLEAAGYWPAAFIELGRDDPTLRALAAALADPDVPPEGRSQLRVAVEALAAGMRALGARQAELERRLAVLDAPDRANPAAETAPGGGAM